MSTNDYNPLMSSFFWANDKNVPSSARQRIALAMMMNKRANPKNLGEGLSSIGDSLSDAFLGRGIMQEAARSEEAAAAFERKVLADEPPAAAAAAAPRPPPIVPSSPNVATPPRPAPAPPPAAVGPQAAAPGNIQYPPPTGPGPATTRADLQPPPLERALSPQMVGQAQPFPDPDKALEEPAGPGPSFAERFPGEPTYGNSRGTVVGQRPGVMPWAQDAVRNTAAYGDPGSMPPMNAQVASNQVPASRGGVGSELAGMGPGDLAQANQLRSVTGVGNRPPSQSPYPQTASRGDIATDAPPVGLNPQMDNAVRNSVAATMSAPPPVQPNLAPGMPGAAAGNVQLAQAGPAPPPAGAIRTAPPPPPAQTPQTPQTPPAIAAPYFTDPGPAPVHPGRVAPHPIEQRINEGLRQLPPGDREAARDRVKGLLEQAQKDRETRQGIADKEHADKLAEHRAKEAKLEDQRAAQRAADLAALEAQQRIDKGKAPERYTHEGQIYERINGKWTDVSPNATGRPVFKGTEFQSKTLPNYVRTQLAVDELTPVEEKTLAESMIAGRLGQMGIRTYPGQNEAYKNADTARENFVQAFIRQQSGAGYGVVEAESEARSMTPAYGDTAEQLSQKRAQRDAFVGSARDLLGSESNRRIADERINEERAKKAERKVERETKKAEGESPPENVPEFDNEADVALAKLPPRSWVRVGGRLGRTPK